MDKIIELKKRLIALQEKISFLKSAVNGVSDKDPLKRRKEALNVGAWIYAIEQLLQRIKNINRPSFDSNIKPLIDTYLDDDAISWWLKIRHNLIHDIPPSFSVSTHIRFLGPRELEDMNKQAPSGVIATFIGDELGGSGWEIGDEDGKSIGKIYFNIPNSVADVTVNFPDSPNSESIEILANKAFVLTTKLVEEVSRWAQQYIK